MDSRIVYIISMLYDEIVLTASNISIDNCNRLLLLRVFFFIDIIIIFYRL